MRLRRGQTSTEYLIILAVVIVIALVAVSVLGGFPSLLGAQSTGMVSDAYWNAARVSITDYRVAKGDARFYFMNKMRFPIKVHNITVDDNVLEAANGKILTSGASLLVEDAGFDCSPGEKFAYDVTVVYTYVDTGLGPFYFTGGKKLSGTCQ